MLFCPRKWHYPSGSAAESSTSRVDEAAGSVEQALAQLIVAMAERKVATDTLARRLNALGRHLDDRKKAIEELIGELP